MDTITVIWRLIWEEVECNRLVYMAQMTRILRPDFFHITPTKLELLKAMKICDILNPSFPGIAGDICYLYALLKP
jgi:hypothetical protein